METNVIEIKEENKFKLTPKTLSKVSLIINKMGISKLILDLNENSDDPEKDQEVIVKKLLALVIDNLYKAADEVIELIAEVKKITKEEAEDVDIIPIIKDIVNNEKIVDSLKLT